MELTKMYNGPQLTVDEINVHGLIWAILKFSTSACPKILESNLIFKKWLQHHNVLTFFGYSLCAFYFILPNTICLHDYIALFRFSPTDLFYFILICYKDQRHFIDGNFIYCFSAFYVVHYLSRDQYYITNTYLVRD